MYKETKSNRMSVLSLLLLLLLFGSRTGLPFFLFIGLLLAYVSYYMVLFDVVCSYWDLIPSGVDVLVTHGPPANYGGYTFDGMQLLCKQAKM